MISSPSFRALYLGQSTAIAQTLDENLGQILRGEQGEGTPTLQFIHVTSQHAALETLRQEPAHCLFFDVDNLRQRRVRLCTVLRERYPGVPIIAICLTPIEDHPFAFDGMIQTPVQPRPLQAVLRAVLHRYQENILQAGPIRLNMSTRVVEGPKGRHQLSPKQSCLLQVLMQHQGETVSRGELMWQVWQTRFMDDTRTLDVHVRWLREKIEPDPSHPVHLITVRGKGYRLVV